MTLPNLERKDLKLFANDAAAQDNIAVFGSLASANPQFSKDIEAIQNLPAFLQGWAGAITGDASPALEDFNALFYVLFYQMAYLFQKGVAQWKATTDYYKGSFTTDGNGALYVSIVDNNVGNDPATSPAAWKKFPTPQDLENLQNSKVSKSGDTMTGPLILKKDGLSNTAQLQFKTTINQEKYPIDEYTLALWHFDEGQSDEISQLPFNSVYPNFVLSANSKFGSHSLQYRDENVNPFVSSKLFTDRDILRTSWTMDCWFYNANSNNSRLLMGPISGSSTISGTGVRVYNGSLYMYNEGQITTTISNRLKDGKWYHLALQASEWDGKFCQLTLFLNGKFLHTQKQFAMQPGLGLSILDSYNVLLDELRISSIDRYTEDFTPLTEAYGVREYAEYDNILDGNSDGVDLIHNGESKGRLLTAADLPGSAGSKVIGFPNLAAGVSITLPYTATTNGWIFFGTDPNFANTTIGLLVNGNKLSYHGSWARDGRDGYYQFGDSIPVSAGQVVSLPPNTVAASFYTFFPMI